VLCSDSASVKNLAITASITGRSRPTRTTSPRSDGHFGPLAVTAFARIPSDDTKPRSARGVRRRPAARHRADRALCYARMLRQLYAMRKSANCRRGRERGARLTTAALARPSTPRVWQFPPALRRRPSTISTTVRRRVPTRCSPEPCTSPTDRTSAFGIGFGAQRCARSRRRRATSSRWHACLASSRAQPSRSSRRPSLRGSAAPP